MMIMAMFVVVVLLVLLALEFTVWVTNRTTIKMQVRNEESE